MPRYNYICSNNCTIMDLIKSKDEIKSKIFIQYDLDSDLSQLFVWEKYKSIKDDSDTFCPLCGGLAIQTFLNTSSIPGVIVKGKIYENPKANRIQIDKSILEEKDPYSKWRQPGEKDLLIKSLNKRISLCAGSRRCNSLVSKRFQNVINIDIQKLIEIYEKEINNGAITED
jgi:predicted nucleic acid-binding Zn ribbon protein